MPFGKIRVLGDLKADVWQRIYSVTFAEAVTSFTISDLAGDTDAIYLVRAKIVSGYNGTGLGVFLKPNGDGTGANYDWQEAFGQNSSTTANRNSSAFPIRIGNVNALGNMSYSETIIQAKSGKVRTAIVKALENMAGTAIDAMTIWGWSWNNTADEITSLVIGANAASGIGVGSQIELYKLVRSA